MIVTEMKTAGCLSKGMSGLVAPLKRRTSCQQNPPDQTFLSASPCGSDLALMAVLEGLLLDIRHGKGVVGPAAKTSSSLSGQTRWDLDFCGQSRIDVACNHMLRIATSAAAAIATCCGTVGAQ